MRQYVVDAFTDHVFAGNPAAVCVMDKWLDEATMMAITRENNLSETAFAVKEGEKYHLRWFTPGGEIDLCGHATLGTACAIMNGANEEAVGLFLRQEIGFNDIARRVEDALCRVEVKYTPSLEDILEADRLARAAVLNR